MADLYDAEVFRDFYCVEKQYITGRSTVLIDYPTGAGQISEEGGTGTLLPNGWILTCRHVIEDKEQAAKARIYFRFWRDQAGLIPTQHEGFQLDPEKGFLTDKTGLDWVLVKLKDHSPQLFPFYVRPPDVPELEKDQRLMIFQCPNKHYLKFAQGSCSHIEENVVTYSINTNRGSSGGPVLNHAGDMVAIHRADKDSNNNQGIPLRAIIEELNRLAPQVMPEMCNYAKIHPVSINLVKEKIHKYVNLPAVPNLFKGREEDIERVRLALTDSGDSDSEYRGRCVVFGLGGIGKTRMVIEYARRYRDQYSSILLVEARSP